MNTRSIELPDGSTITDRRADEAMQLGIDAVGPQILKDIEMDVAALQQAYGTRYEQNFRVSRWPSAINRAIGGRVLRKDDPAYFKEMLKIKILTLCGMHSPIATCDCPGRIFTGRDERIKPNNAGAINSSSPEEILDRFSLLNELLGGKKVDYTPEELEERIANLMLKFAEKCPDFFRGAAQPGSTLLPVLVPNIPRTAESYTELKQLMRKLIPLVGDLCDNSGSNSALHESAFEDDVFIHPGFGDAVLANRLVLVAPDAYKGINFTNAADHINDHLVDNKIMPLDPYTFFLMLIQHSQFLDHEFTQMFFCGPRYSYSKVPTFSFNDAGSNLGTLAFPSANQDSSVGIVIR